MAGTWAVQMTVIGLLFSLVLLVNATNQVLERGEKIELLVDKTDRLNQTAFKFEKTSKQLKEVRLVVVTAAAAVMVVGHDVDWGRDLSCNRHYFGKR